MASNRIISYSCGELGLNGFECHLRKQDKKKERPDGNKANHEK
jgi:hypothetical protein